MIEQQRAAGVDGDYVAFRETGEDVTGSFRCADCGYGIVVAASLPLCPMCGGTAWEDSESSPFGRSPQL